MNKQMKNEAVTLIALIVTIIILIILAGVSVMGITKFGIMDKTKIAKEKYTDAQEKEENELNKMDNAMIDGVVSTRDQKQYVTDEVAEILDIANTKVEMKDIMSSDFMKKISTSEEAKKKMLDNETFRNRKDITLLNALNCALVPTPSNNNNILYSSCYWSGYDPFLGFRSDYNYFCTATGQVTNQYIGYNFNTDINVKIVKFYNALGYSCRQAKIQFSDDNKIYKDASEIYTFANSSQNVFMFNTKEDKKHQYWRVLLINSYSSSYIGINSMQFYGI